MIDSRPVLVNTRLDDPTADHVIGELHRRGVPVVRLDTGRPEGVTLAVGAGAGKDWRGDLRTPTRQVDPHGIRAVYHRRPSPTASTFPADDPAGHQRDFTTAQIRHGLSGLLVALPDCLQVNHPHRNAAAEYKPVQLTTALASDFTVPPTLITNEPEAAREFIRAHHPVVYKPLRHTDYRENGELRTIWVRPVTAEEIDSSLRACPHLFQKQVIKTADARMAVVGGESFTTRITLDGDHPDWRMDYSLVSFSPVEAPATVRRSAELYLRTLGLVFGAFDFAIDRDGAWHFLECNPNGQWAFVDPATTRGITVALADVLEKGVSP
ncbi:ATP-grasp ribosomal peptide maturase [Streptomyces alkaliphilus]|uniref:ATP-grasp ribosomal peptide maturase n=1 Tax=Streptomyces alkaliphilus TaxID=1472722 RepID=A0A7W3TD74_9ACTN|nr:ATP-grasp ribosomal peptide maturase [Streptomyces alkaliphilus]MBB0244711.1 ATP-grasp ribosomal peptide maturase [Streptomyces alkaliphilus]